jgi:hypothetical protein
MSVRAVACGGPELTAAMDALGIEIAAPEKASVAVVDLRDPEFVSVAASLPRALPRILVMDPQHRALVDALGFPLSAIAASCEPAVLGPVIASVLPAARRPATRSIVVTSVRGGAGRTLLTANLARRLARERPTLAIDLTGSGDLAWWLGAHPSSWRELEGMSEELNVDHLAVLAVEVAPGLRLAGGPPVAPSGPLGLAVLRAGLDLAELVVIDAPHLAEQRTQILVERADRVLVLSYPDPVSVASLDAVDLPPDAWFIGSQTSSLSLGGREVFRALPRDEEAVTSATNGPRAASGALGAAYDDLAGLIAIDAS